MKLRIVHTFACSAEAYLALIDDPRFEALLARESNVERRIVEHRDEGGVRFKRVRCVPDRELPAVVAKAVGARRIEYDQITEVDTATGLLRWRIASRVAPDRVHIAGTMTLHPREEGVERVVEGDVEVRVPLVGGRIERSIVDDVERSYDRAAAAMRRWIAEERG